MSKPSNLLFLLPMLFSYTLAGEIQNIFAVIAKGNGGVSNATAFFITPTRLLTAAHVFNDTGTKDVSIIKDGVKVACTVAKLDKKNDVAVLECVEANATALVLYEPVFYNIGIVQEKDKSLVEKRSEGVQELGKVVWTTNSSMPGMSGCPIVDDQGRVVGMCVRGDTKNNKSCGFVPAKILIKVLEK